MNLLLFFSVKTTNIGTATPTLDYEPVDRSLNLTSTSPVCITINVLQDLNIEGTETFHVELTTANPRVQIAQRLASVSIMDDGNCINVFQRFSSSH